MLDAIEEEMQRSRTCWRTAARIPASTVRISFWIFCISGSTPERDASVVQQQQQHFKSHQHEHIISYSKERDTHRHKHLRFWNVWEPKKKKRYRLGTSGWCTPKRSICPLLTDRIDQRKNQRDLWESRWWINRKGSGFAIHHSTQHRSTSLARSSGSILRLRWCTHLIDSRRRSSDVNSFLVLIPIKIFFQILVFIIVLKILVSSPWNYLLILIVFIFWN